jgi:hypothetical protein
MIAAYKKGMIYADHDFATNFCNAVGYNDPYMQKHILIDEIGRLVTNQKKDIVDLLRNNGFNVTLNDNLIKISTILSQQIEKENNSIIEPLIDIIYKNNEVHNFCSDGTKIKEYTDKIGKNLHEIMQEKLVETFKRKSKDTHLSLDGQNLLNERIKLNEMYNAAGTNPMPKWIKISIWIGVAGVIITAAVFIIKKLGKSDIKITPDIATVPTP